MNISELFIRRPVMTTLVMSGILLFGLLSYRYLPVSDLPNVDYPTLQVSASLPGASPETMASAVATPLERESLRSGDLAEVQRLIREAETPRPSTRFSTLGTRSDVATHRRVEPGRLGALL